MYYYLYVPYVVILSIWVFMDSRKHGIPRWWSLLVLASPVTVLVYAFMSRPANWKKSLIFCLVSMVAMGVGGYALEARSRSGAIHISNYSPEATELMELATTLRDVTDKMDRAVDRLEELSRVESKLQNMGETVQLIGEMKVLIIQHRNAEISLIRFAGNNQSLLEREGLGWLLSIKTYYENRVVIHHMEVLEEYLEDFEALLNYIIGNFREIEMRTPKYIQNYDAYYLSYRRAVDRHNAINIRRVQYQDAMLKKYPELKLYLPSIRQVKLIF
ncbi:MAG: hypothetical protein V1793_01975 [Pseudomonadota bacterium]